jgi:hypothetical protein
MYELIVLPDNTDEKAEILNNITPSTNHWLKSVTITGTGGFNLQYIQRGVKQALASCTQINHELIVVLLLTKPQSTDNGTMPELTAIKVLYKMRGNE